MCSTSNANRASHSARNAIGGAIGVGRRPGVGRCLLHRGGSAFRTRRSEGMPRSRLLALGACAWRTPGAGTVDHLAFEVRSLREFHRVYRRLRAGEIEIYPSDNGISWAIYFHDPDGTRLEVYLDRREQRGGQALWRGKVRPLSERRIASAVGRTGRTG